MIFVERVVLPVMLGAGLVGCGNTSVSEPPSSQLRFSSPVVITKEADATAKVFVADANDDAWLDALTWANGAPYVNIAIPEQGLSQPYKVAGLPSGPIRQAAWLDLTGDRNADVIVLDGDGLLRRFHSEDFDEYSEQTLKLPTLPPLVAFAISDLNRDDALDFVLLSERPEADAGAVAVAQIYVLLGLEGGRYELAQELSFQLDEGAAQLTAFLQPVDISGDGRWDIAVGIPGVGTGWLEQLDAVPSDGGLPPAFTEAGADAAAPVGEPAGAPLFRYTPFDHEASDVSAALFVDHDDDGDVDWFRLSEGADVRLFLNTDDAAFDAQNGDKGLPSGGLGCVDDFDNDGRLDVVSVDDGVIALKLGTRDPAKFTDGLELSPRSALPISSLLCIDMDNDGDLDLLTAGNKGTGLYLNRLEPIVGRGANYFDFRFEGNDGNPAAFGTSVEVGVGKRTLRRDFVASGHAFLATAPALHLGLGDATLLDTVRITWPNGEVVEASEWTVNDTVTATHP